MSKIHEEFLYKNFELLFSKEPPSNDTLIGRLENRFNIVDIKDNGPQTNSISSAFSAVLVSGASPPVSSVAPVEQDNPEKKKRDYLKIEFDKLRATIDQIINPEQTMSGGNLPSLKYIKKYINDKIKDIIPRD